MTLHDFASRSPRRMVFHKNVISIKDGPGPEKSRNIPFNWATYRKLSWALCGALGGALCGVSLALWSLAQLESCPVWSPM